MRLRPRSVTQVGPLSPLHEKHGQGRFARTTMTAGAPPLANGRGLFRTEWEGALPLERWWSRLPAPTYRANVQRSHTTRLRRPTPSHKILTLRVFDQRIAQFVPPLQGGAASFDRFFRRRVNRVTWAPQRCHSTAHPTHIHTPRGTNLAPPLHAARVRGADPPAWASNLMITPPRVYD